MKNNQSVDENIKYLLHSTRMGKLDEVKLFIEERNVDVNYTDNIGSTALHEATLRGYDAIVEYLLSKGANVEAKTVSDNPKLSGITPLIYAVKCGHVSTAKILIDHGAEVNMVVNDCILLGVASETDNPEMIKLLLDNGADVNDDRGCDSVVPLSIALIKGKYQNARFLLDRDADYKKYSSQGYSPLLYAAQRSESGEGVELLLKHVEEKEGKEKLLEYINYNGADNGRTALHVACLRKNYHATKVLLEHGANYKVKDKEGSEPYHLIACNSARFPFLEDNSRSHVAEEIRHLIGVYADRDYCKRFK